MLSQIKIDEWATGLMGTGNISSKVLIVWRLIDHRGYLVIKQDLSLMRLRIVKQYLLLQSP